MNWATIKSHVADRLFSSEIDSRVQQAVEQVRQAIPSLLTYDASMAGFRRLVGSHQEQASLRDLPMPTHERMQDIAYFLYLTNPMAKWLIKISAAYQLGGGLTLSAKDPAVQQLVDSFWNDPVNQWPMKLPKKVRELAIYGEQCWPAFVAPGTGRVRLGYLDPALIAQVVLDPDNAEQPLGLVTKQWTQYQTMPERKYRVILDVADDELTPLAQRMRAEFTDGECFYFATNGVSNGSRGMSDLLDKADWLDGYEQFMFNRLERADLANRVLVDLTMTGMTQEQINEFAKTFTLPRPGGAHIHNEKIALEMKAPKLEAADAAVDARLFKHQCLAGFPEHWMGGGGDVNRATAGEMDEPTFKLLEDAQQMTKGMIAATIRFAIREAKRVGTLPQAAEETVDIQMPEMVKADMGKLADSFERVSRSAQLNVTNGIMTKEEARQMVSLVAKPLGIKLAPKTEEELNRMADERALDDASVDYRVPVNGKQHEKDQTNNGVDRANGKGPAKPATASREQGVAHA